MIVKTDSIKQISNKILSAIDNENNPLLVDTLEMITREKVLYFNITGKEYYVQISVPLADECDFHATVNANMFLKLISQITTEDVELTVTDKTLIVTGNGKFKIPLMFAFDKLLTLPEYSIEVVTQMFSIKNEILSDIANFNTRQIAGKVYSDVIRKSYYLDDKGCITFTTGACVNNFKLDKPIKLLLGAKVVRLFKLFTDDEITFELGFNQVGDAIQTRIRLTDSVVKLAVITYSTDALISKFHADELREKASMIYPYNTSINRRELIQAINRFMIFKDYDINDSECRFIFTADTLIIENKTGDSESIKLANSINDTYEVNLDIILLKDMLDASKDQMVNLSFGNHEVIVITEGNISNILPECE